MDGLTLDHFMLYTRIAALRSLSGVARERDVPVSRISRALAQIESACGVQLVRRTTHGLSLTSEGEVFLTHAQRLVEERTLLADKLSSRHGAIQGTVRLSIASLLAEHVLIPKLPLLRASHPGLHVDLHIADSMADIALDGIDILVRAGVMPAETLIVRSLGWHGRALYAAPAYLDRHGEPAHVDALTEHGLITSTSALHHNQWAFVVDGKEVVRTMRGTVQVNNSAAVVSLALAGVGIARINDVIGKALVSQGRLRPVLANCCVPGRYEIHAAILAERHRAAKIRACMDFLNQCFQDFATYSGGTGRNLS